jgi:proline iminopeptidase
MRGLFPAIEPYDHDMLAVGDGNLVYWETCGNPCGKPAVVVHGGPGSGCTDWQRRLFDPAAYRVVLFDQRGCGRSTPHASALDTDLTSNTTWKLIEDMESLRGHLGIDRWLVLAGSWGSTLALAYAERFPDRVTEMILFGVTTGRHAEFDWLFRGGVAVFFPEQWARLRAALPLPVSDPAVVAGYRLLLHDPDPGVRQRAAVEWCRWESATLAWPPTTGLSRRFRDPRFALAFARLVTHYVRHNAWLDDGSLLRGADALLAEIPGVLVNGRFDFQAPIANAWELSRVWPRAELVIVDDAGHAADAAISEQLVRATDRFALNRTRTQGTKPPGSSAVDAG